MIVGDRIFNELDTERIICIGGSLSGGKTRLAFDLARYYWRRGWRVNSNTAHNFKTYGADPFHLFKTFNIVDEGGEYVRSAKIASLITRSAGKADYYVVFAGKRPPHKNLQDIIVKPRFDFYQNYGLPVILWRVRVNSDIPYVFTFWQILPQRIHGTFSTRSSSGGIETFIKRAEFTVQELARMEGQDAGIQVEAGVKGFADDLAETFGGFER